MNNNGILTIRQSPYQIDIQDEGIGMTQEQINRLGEPYFTTKEKGTGLGMMVSFSIIKGMGGNITVESDSGKGYLFFYQTTSLYETNRIEKGRLISSRIVNGPFFCLAV